jgi:hypothetical protein
MRLTGTAGAATQPTLTGGNAIPVPSCDSRIWSRGVDPDDRLKQSDEETADEETADEETADEETADEETAERSHGRPLRVASSDGHILDQSQWCPSR